MYAPFFYPFQQQQPEMTPDQALQFYKSINELIKEASKPKEEKKKEDPDKWGPWDYLTLILFINALIIPIGAVTILWAATDFMKAIPH